MKDKSKIEVAEKNTALWMAVRKTDPAFTKHVNQRGGFTAISAHYQRFRATQLWGPYGSAWGLRGVQYGYVNKPDGTPLEIYVEAEFYYPETFGFPGGSFPISADLLYKPGQDCRKKVATAATSKALSFLGFSADIFLDNQQPDFSDNPYINPPEDLTSYEIKRVKDGLRSLLRDYKGEDRPTIIDTVKDAGNDLATLKGELAKLKKKVA